MSESNKPNPNPDRPHQPAADAGQQPAAADAGEQPAAAQAGEQPAAADAGEQPAAAGAGEQPAAAEADQQPTAAEAGEQPAAAGAGDQPPGQPDPGPPPPSGAEAPAQPEQPTPEPQPAPAPPAQPVAVLAARRPPRLMRTWLAATIGAIILVAAGLGGFFIGAATNDHDRDRPGAGRYDHRPFGPDGDDNPRFRDSFPNR